MARIAEPYIIHKRGNSFQITLNRNCGLPWRICAEWKRRSIKTFPDELFNYQNPKTKADCKTSVLALITFLRKKQEEGAAGRIVIEDVTVGDWIERFTRLETSPRTGINASKNRPYSVGTVAGYQCLFNCHIKGDSLAGLKMAEVQEEDVLDYMTRLSVKKKIVGGSRKIQTDDALGGTRTFSAVVKFIKMTFNVYQRKNRRWFNPFLHMEQMPKHRGEKRDALPEEEMLKLFDPGVLATPMELAVCAAIFLSGLRRAEVFALKPEDLDWDTPQINVRRAWQRFDHNEKKLGPPKGKRSRRAPFDPVLQEAIKRLWKENGKHEFVFCRADGSILGSSWISYNFKNWLKRAGIVLRGRNIVPHSARHSLATLLEKRGVPLRYIQDLLGHADLETTKIYLVDTARSIREIGEKITEAMERGKEETGILNFKVS
jgi:integrase